MALPTLTLTTPCTVTQLVEFVQHQVVGVYEGATAGNTDVTSTLTSIVIAGS